jgi:hypothetical protein
MHQGPSRFVDALRRALNLRGALSGALAALAVVGLIVALSPDARAKSSYDSAYGFEKTWNAGLRLVRVDLNLKVTEKDDTNGYLLFDYRSPEAGPKPVPGSMEFIKNPDGHVRVIVQIPQMPGYHEQVMLDNLARKLRDEYGDPPRQPPAPVVKDAGADAEP